MSFFGIVVVVTNIGFTAGYDTDVRCPRWVAYDLEPHMVVKGKRKPYSFRADPQIGPMSNVEPFYRRTPGAFDRGHLCPSADMCWSTNAQRQTFYFSNVCPQKPSFNRGEWKRTEEEVRRLAESGTVHVVIVPLDFVHADGIGKKWTFPTRFVKVAYGWFGARVWDLAQECARTGLGDERRTGNDFSACQK